MIRWIIAFLVLAIVAGLFGFGLIASTAAGIAQVLFYIFIIFLIISLVRYFFP